MDEGQTYFWLVMIVNPIVATCHLECIVTRVFKLVKDNPRELVSGIFIRGLTEGMGKIREKTFIDRFSSEDHYFDFAEIFLELIYNWMTEAIKLHNWYIR
jgi:hypothetical protein